MKIIADRIATHLVENQVITLGEQAWCAYGLQKRMETGVTLLLLLAVGGVLRSVPCAFVFTVALLVLRVRTNGYHAKSYARCLFASVLTEALSMLALPFFSYATLLVLLLGSLFVILAVGCVNDERIHFTAEELQAAKRRARLCGAALGVCAVAVSNFSLFLFGSIVLAVAMAAFSLLVVATQKQ